MALSLETAVERGCHYPVLEIKYAYLLQLVRDVSAANVLTGELKLRVDSADGFCRSHPSPSTKHEGTIE